MLPPCLRTCSQEEGEYEKWKNKNEFKLYDLVDMPAFVQDVKDESSYMIDWKKMELEAAEKEAAEQAEQRDKEA